MTFFLQTGLGGILVAWKGSLFSGNRINSCSYALSMGFCSRYDNSKWALTCVYGPCTTEGKVFFVNWFKNFQMAPNIDRLILGDFNLIRGVEDRNKPRGDLIEIFRFNAVVSHLGINEIVLQGRKFTWSNMQPSPLLEKLDWVFTSSSWAISYPSTSVKALDMIPSDHCPCIVNISTAIPRNRIFRFENHWLKLQDF